TQQWNLTAEHEFSQNMSLSVGYLGNKGTRLLSQVQPLNALNPSLLSMGNALYDRFKPGMSTLDGVNIPYAGWVEQMKGCEPSVAQALLPYPQYCSRIYGQNENVGNSTYHSLQAKLEKRFSKGMSLLVSYTFSKNLTDAESAQASSSSTSGGGIRISPFQQNRMKGLSSTDVPHMLAASLLYDLPFGKGRQLLNRG